MAYCAVVEAVLSVEGLNMACILPYVVECDLDHMVDMSRIT